ncbi:autotransporter domain-containing protein [Alcaligenaceae bacterium]|nr:autotransporter domain-containing protein [Alcaligenaceae bacterium]
MGENNCVWGRITGNATRMDGTGGTPGLKSEGVWYQVGAQRSIAPNWFVGVAGAYENRTIRSDEKRQRIEGDRLLVGWFAIPHVPSRPCHNPGTLSYGRYALTRLHACRIVGTPARSAVR